MYLKRIPLKRTMPKEGMKRTKAREMCKTARRRVHESLMAQWENDAESAYQMLREQGRRRRRVKEIMAFAEAEGKDPNDNKMSREERDERERRTSVVRYTNPKAHSHYAPPAKKVPGFRAMLAAPLSGKASTPQVP